jgi:trehalose utilization protein
MPDNPVRVLVWDEAPTHAPKSVYPSSINGAIAEGLNALGGGAITATTANLDGPEQGITEDALAGADVLVWWGHARHDELADEKAEMIKASVHRGLGFIALHSAHYSKPFRRILDCTGHLYGGWRETENPADSEEITVCAPKHPIAQGVSGFVLPAEEMYGAPFGVPPPQAIIFQSYFPLGGEYFPSFVTTVGEGIDPKFTSGGGKGANRGEGAGRVFYFRPGHEIYPTYLNASVKQILHNGVLWAARRTS